MTSRPPQRLSEQSASQLGDSFRGQYDFRGDKSFPSIGAFLKRPEQKLGEALVGRLNIHAGSKYFRGKGRVDQRRTQLRFASHVQPPCARDQTYRNRDDEKRGMGFDGFLTQQITPTSLTTPILRAAS